MILSDDWHAFIESLNSHGVEYVIATSISGVNEERLWLDRIPGTWEGSSVWWIDRTSLIKNKRAVGRPKDLMDLELLGEGTKDR